MIENLKKHLMSEGKTGSWLELANQFNILPDGSNKQKSDKVRKIFNSLDKNIPTFVNLGKDGPMPWMSTGGDTATITTFNPYGTGGTGSYQFNPEWQTYTDWAKTKLPEPKKTNGIHIVLGCVHVPYHNKELIVKLTSFIQDNRSKIVGFHLIGDYLDLKSLSSHDDKTIDKSGWTLGREYEAGNLILDLFDSILPKGIDKTFIYGNHEDRYFRYVSNIKNYKTGDAIASPTQALKLESRGYKVYENWKEDCVQIGKYQVFHGVYCTTNSTKTHVDKLRQSCMFAHTHRLGEHFEGQLHGVNIGCLADMNSDGFKYLSRIERQTWSNGFGIINVHGNHSQAELITCTNNHFFYAGKQY